MVDRMKYLRIWPRKRMFVCKHRSNPNTDFINVINKCGNDKKTTLKLKSNSISSTLCTSSGKLTKEEKGRNGYGSSHPSSFSTRQKVFQPYSCSLSSLYQILFYASMTKGSDWWLDLILFGEYMSLKFLQWNSSLLHTKFAVILLPKMFKKDTNICIDWEFLTENWYYVVWEIQSKTRSKVGVLMQSTSWCM